MDSSFWNDIGEIDAKYGSIDVPDLINLPGANYSNEGRNYPTEDSTRGSGGSPFNASLINNLPLTNVNGAPDLGGLKSLFKTLTQNSSGRTDYAKLLPLLYGLYGASQSNRRTQPAGYQGGIPTYTATRQAPSQGQSLSGNVTFTPKAAGGGLKTGGFIFPADVVSHLGNGSSDAGLKALAAKLGATPIRGNGDGMSDSIPTSIDGEEKALVAHEEAYLSPEKVARLGGGDAKKGAKKLRDMMARIREARTGTTEQGKQIDPSKFMPGGEVKRYQTGGATGVGAAAAAGVTGTESSLSNWAGPYVTDMLAKGQALSEMPFEQYQGPLTAGPSQLQTQAFNTAANLQTPAAIGQAANTAGQLASSLQNLSYSPAQIGNQFQAPTQSAATQFTNQYQAPGAYQTGTFGTREFGSADAARYMNPYLESSLAPQLAELQRQNQIANLGDMSKLTRAGAFGGGRQAVLQAENTRNLMDKINQVTGQGYNTAFTNAMSQFNADQARQQQVQKDIEQSRQFGATQGMTAAQLQAQYGLSAQQAQEAARQFNQGQAMTAAQQQAQYGLAGRQAEEQSRQFGANYGLQGLQSALQAAQAQGNLGLTQNQADLANLNTLAALGGTQRGIMSEDIAARKAAFDEARVNPFKMVQFQQSLLQGLPLAAQTYNMQDTNNMSQFSNNFLLLSKALETLGVKPG